MTESQEPFEGPEPEPPPYTLLNLIQEASNLLAQHGNVEVCVGNPDGVTLHPINLELQRVQVVSEGIVVAVVVFDNNHTAHGWVEASNGNFEPDLGEVPEEVARDARPGTY